MLTHLHITDFVLVKKLELECHNGLTTVTGETGAGKSIMLDALSLAIGAKTDADKVRHGCLKAEIHATFDIAHQKQASQWIINNDLNDEQSTECLLRRVITAEGRSRAFINGKSATLGQLKELGGLLLDIHSQHEHQSLLNTHTHRRLLDEYANASTEANITRQAFSAWMSTSKKLAKLRQNTAQANARFQLLQYQVNELKELNIEENEIDSLEKEQKLLSGFEELQLTGNKIQNLCNDEQNGILTNLYASKHLLEELDHQPEHFKNALTLLNEATINLQEAQAEIDRQLDNPNEDSYQLTEVRLPEVEKRLSNIYNISRKHRIHPNELYAFQQKICEEFKQLSSGDTQIAELEEDVENALQHYHASAARLSKKRQKHAPKLAKQINQKLALLAMEHSEFVPSLQSLNNQPSAHGNEQSEFLISTNLGQPPKPLTKIASGGELSRISLAIQVVTAQTSTTPTLIFDEVDVGIGGTTGDTVGHLLRELGDKAQIICVTHLPQVASKAHQHWVVSKKVAGKEVESEVTQLSKQQKIEEIARMMGGDTQSDHSLAHARQILRAVS